MPLQKQPVNINFQLGLDLKSDAWQVQVGNFLELENSIFTKTGLLQKRNGFQALPSLPDASNTFSTTFNGNLTAIGTSLSAFIEGSQNWVNQGALQPVQLSVLPLIRSNTNQSQCDSVIAPNGLVCTVFTDNITSGSSTVASYKYVISDSVTGQNRIAPTVIPPGAGTVTGSPRVFLLGRYFVIVFTNIISAVNHLQFIAIAYTNPTMVTTAADISTNYTPVSTVAFDGVVANNNLYLAWNSAAGGGSVLMTFIDSTLLQHNTITGGGTACAFLTLAADTTTSTPIIYVTHYNSSTHNAATFAVTQNLVSIFSDTNVITSEVLSNITSVASNGRCSIFYEVTNAYSYDAGIATNLLKTQTMTQAGTPGTRAVLIRSLGLASKAFILNGTIYMLATYQSTYQPTYFLLNGTGTILVKLAYSNGGGYLALGLPNISISGTTVSIPYLFKDLVQSVNKGTALPTGTQTAGIYSQTGINLASFNINNQSLSVVEIGQNLNLSGGFLWAYDGYKPTEQGFHVWPDSIEATWSATGGSIHAQPDGATNTNAYYYQVTYEWTDNQGNAFKSAPSIPIPVTTTSNGTSGSITVNIPTLRLTAKTANAVKLVVYRWSVAQQSYYQTTSISLPVLNDPTADSIAFVDKNADATILGNNLLYTTGGVVENIGPPACSALTLFKSRLFLIDAEDPNLLWYSKQVIESTPVEMSDLFTLFIAPTTSSQGSTGALKCLAPMDDKLILFKKDAIYYVVGTGPDNTGANNDFSDAIFITSTVGSTNQNSIVFIPQGLLFQSDKGIWLLGRDLSTNYIGAPVEDFNKFKVVSSLAIPGTNQVRFTLENGVLLMYDYYFNQWGTFTGIPAISSTLYQGLHTYLNSFGQVFQEEPNVYMDGSAPVEMTFKTGWIKLAGLQGYERAYEFYLLGKYLSPHRLQVQIGYDYNDSPTQTTTIQPINVSDTYGSDPFYGSHSYGGSSNVEQWRIYLEQQQCEAFQLKLKEIFDPTFGTAPGAGLTLSGVNFIVGVKSGRPRLQAKVQVG